MRNRLGSWVISISLVLGASTTAQARPHRAGVEPPPPDSSWRQTRLEDLGLSNAMRQYTTAPALRLPFSLRQDQVLTEARVALELDLGKAPDGFEPTGLDVRVNDVEIGTITLTRDATAPVVAVPPTLVGDTNTLTIRFSGYEDCQRVPRGAWEIVTTGAVQMRSRPLPLPDDLSVLPLPFLDSRFDRDTTVHFSFYVPASPAVVEAAGLVAGYFGLQGGSKLRFAVTENDLPATSAIVFVTSDNAAALGVPRVTRPTLLLRDHPRLPGENHKLLIVTAPTAEGLRVAASHIALEADKLTGKRVSFKNALVPEPVAAYEAPRWLAPGKSVRFGDIEGGEDLSRHPLTGGTLSLRFRLAPDLSLWPAPDVPLDIAYRIVVPADLPPPTLHAELNGEYLGKLAPPGRWLERGSLQKARLYVPREVLRGYNELSFHADFTAMGDLCGTDERDEIHVEISPDSTLHLDHAAHFVRMPDVSLFVYDGFPFTRIPDLSQTVIGLADKPTTAEVGMLLSVLAHTAAITGTAPTGVRVADADALVAADRLDADLLIVTEGRNNEIVRSWAGRLPVAGLGRSRLEPRRPDDASTILEALSGWQTAGELERARALMGATRYDTSAVMGIASPLGKQRSAVIIALPPQTESNAEPPALRDYLQEAEAHYRRADLLVGAGSRRSMFKIGPSYDVGHVGMWLRMQWVLAHYWLGLFVLFLLVAPMSRVLQSMVDWRRARRLDGDGGGSR